MGVSTSLTHALKMLRVLPLVYIHVAWGPSPPNPGDATAIRNAIMHRILADRTCINRACSMIGYWQDTDLCLSVRLSASVCL